MTTTKYVNPLSLGRKMRPTKAHRPAVWENMLGTVLAMNDAGEVRYFDYRYDDALAFAGYSEDRDPRGWRFNEPWCRYRWHNGASSNTDPRRRQWVLWILKEKKTS